MRRNGAGCALSRREQEVLQHIESGCANKEIAARMNIAEGTVKVYVSRLLDQLELDNRTQLAAWGFGIRAAN